MAKKNTDEVILDVEEAYSKTEKYVEDNKKSLTIIVVIIVGIIGVYLLWDNMIVAPQQKEAQEEMWQAEMYFEKDSFQLALDGDGNTLGFLDIIDAYGMTKSGNLANYYAGISYLRLGQFEDAIEYLESYDGDDEMLGPIAQGAIGDAYSELGDLESAQSYYESAANMRDNVFTTPIYLMKAGLVAESLGNYGQAKNYYTRIKNEYPQSNEGRNVAKYLARSSSF